MYGLNNPHSNRKSWLPHSTPASSRLGNISQTPLAEGDAGTAQTIAAMRGLIDRGKRDPTIHELAARIIRGAGVAPFDWRGEATAIFAWVRGNIRFTRDVYGDEALHTAPEIVRLGIGDCDDFTVLICSLLETCGHHTRIVTISSNPSDPEAFSHVFPEVELEGRWIPVDVGRKSPAFGKGPEHYFRRREWDASGPYFQDVQGYGANTMSRLRGLSGLGASVPPNRLPPGAMRPHVVPQLRAAQKLFGLGHYGASAVRRNTFASYGRLGQDDDDTGFDWSQFETELPSLVTAGTTGATNIIKAVNQPTTAAYQAQALTAEAQMSTSSLSTMLLLGGGLLVVVMLMRGSG
jgi:Transglutaminase-like superfamily